MFSVPVTPELRAKLARTHREVSGTFPSNQQFDNTEQHDLISVCQEYMFENGEAVEFNEEVFASNLCELLHFLFMNGVPIAKVHKNIRVNYTQTQKLSVRIGIEQKQAADAHAEKMMKSVTPVESQSAALQGAMV